MQDYSIVEYFTGCEGHSCGYCSRSNSSKSQGMWAHKMTVQDYQHLIDRGWRRSGKYCYKPKMSETCCPQYTIRCHAKDFKLSKSQKKVAKKMQHFIQNGERPSDNKPASSALPERQPSQGEVTVTSSSNANTSSIDKPTSPKQPRPGVGADPSRPPRRKAKQIRMERKMEKLKTKGKTTTTFSTTANETMASRLPDLLSHLTQLPNAKHKLEIKVIFSDKHNEEFLRTKKESLELYQKYQHDIHKDPPSKCSEEQWMRFLVHSPLVFDRHGPGKGFGSFHNQYWIDDKLVAVGVIDVLPKSVSSVYLYYDTDYSFLSLGVYSALSEIYLVTQLQKHLPSLEYYYIGFYIHSCPKMRYKAGYSPSDLLCPETYNWIPLPLCLSTLDKQRYARLNELNGGSPDDVDDGGRMSTLDAVRCLFRRSITDYGMYKLHKFSRSCRNNLDQGKVKAEDEEIQEYASLVGRTCAKRMLLYRSDDDEE